MTEPSISIATLSDQFSSIVQRAAASVVAVHGGARQTSSGIHWRSGVIVTAEEVLERDEGITLSLPGGRQVSASLAGRDPSTDIAALRFDPAGMATAELGQSPAVRAGDIVFSVGNHRGGPVAGAGIVAFAGGAWESMRGGTIDSLIRLDMSLSRNAEGGALVDAKGQVLGMAVSGPRRRALAIPRATIERILDPLLAKGRIARGYLGAGLRAARLRPQDGDTRSPDGGSGVLVVSIDDHGPGARAGLLVGDIIVAWDGKPVARVRDIMRLLGSDSVGSTVELGLLRGGTQATLAIALGERAASGS